MGLAFARVHWAISSDYSSVASGGGGVLTFTERSVGGLWTWAFESLYSWILLRCQKAYRASYRKVPFVPSQRQCSHLSTALHPLASQTATVAAETLLGQRQFSSTARSRWLAYLTSRVAALLPLHRHTSHSLLNSSLSTQDKVLFSLQPVRCPSNTFYQHNFA